MQYNPNFDISQWNKSLAITAYNCECCGSFADMDDVFTSLFAF